MRTSKLAFAMVTLGWAHAASAQDPKSVERERVSSSLSDPSLGSAVNSDGTRITLESSTVDSVAKAFLGVNLGDSQIGLSLEAPVRKGSKETVFADLNGLRGGTAATLSLTRYFIKASADMQPVLALCEEVNRTRARAASRELITPLACTREGLAVRGGAWPDRVAAAHTSGLVAACNAANKDAVRPKIVLELGECTAEAVAIRGANYVAMANAKEAEVLKAACEDRNAAPVEGLLASCTYGALIGAGLESRAVAAAGIGTHKILNLFVTGRSDDFEFVELPSFEKQKQTKRSLAIGGSLGLVTRDDVYLGVGFRSERTFKAGNAAQYCVPVAAADAERCEEFVVGAPTSQSAEIFHAEARYYPAAWLGLIPRISYESKAKVTGYQLRAFFLGEKEKGLSGGVDFGYRSDTKALTARVFIGAAFELIP